MFYYCNLINLDLHKFDSSKVTNMNYMFYNCRELANINMEGLNTSKVVSMKHMFANCAALKIFDLKFDTSNVTDMRYMFDGCSGLIDLDLHALNTNNVNNMDYMFHNCYRLVSLNIKGLDTSKVTHMDYMFSGCRALKNLDLSSFDTSRVTSMSSMFNSCSSLTSLDLNNFDTSNVTNMDNMFENCEQLTFLNVSSFNTSKVTRMELMFGFCLNLSYLDLSSFDLRNVNEVTGMLQCNITQYFKISHLFRIIGNNSSMTCLPSPPSSVDDRILTGKWISYDAVDGGPYSEEELWNIIAERPEDTAGTWEWETIKQEYSVAYEPNSATATGSAPSQTWEVGKPQQIASNPFYNMGYRFTGWNTTADGTGTTYQPNETPTTDLGKDGDTITLYAQWEKIDQTINIKDGKFTITLHANEQAYIPNLPAGTTYRITEIQSNPGWNIQKQRNDSGQIESLVDSTATFVNTYKANETSAILSGTKLFDGQTISESSASPAKESYDFILSSIDENGIEQEVQRAASNENGFFTFDKLVFNAAGTYDYTIREDASSSIDNVTYDTHTEKIRITVTDDGQGRLANKVEYLTSEDDADGKILFNNKFEALLPSELIATVNIDKSIDIPSNKDVSFTFIIDYEDPTFEDQKITVTIPAGQTSATASRDDIVADEKFTIRETPTNDYKLTSLNTTGTDGTTVNGSAYVLGVEEILNVSAVNKRIVSGSFMLQATKEMTGKPISGGEFMFGVFASEQDARDAITTKNISKAVVTSTNAADSNIYFDAMEVDEICERDYYIAEIPMNADSIDDADVIYDSTIWKAHVSATLSDTVEGILDCVVTYSNVNASAGNADNNKDGDDDPVMSENVPVFCNSVAGGKLLITKKASNLPDGYNGVTSFNVKAQITPKDGDASEGSIEAAEYAWKSLTHEGKQGTIASGETMNIEFNETIEIDVPNGYTYKVEEQTEGIPFTATYENEAGTIATGQTSNVVITNKYAPTGSAVLDASKSAVGFELTDKQFKFILTNDEGQLIEESTNGIDGAVAFNQLTFGAEDIGRHVYKLYEVDDSQSGIAYDESEYAAVVDVEDMMDGTLNTNVSYVKSSVTGDSDETAGGNEDGEVINGEPVSKPAFVNYKETSMPFSGMGGYGWLMGIGMLIVIIGSVLIFRGREETRTNNDDDRR